MICDSTNAKKKEKKERKKSKCKQTCNMCCFSSKWKVNISVEVTHQSLQKEHPSDY